MGYKLLNEIFKTIIFPFRGLRLGKRYPVFWRVYEFFWKISTGYRIFYHDVFDFKIIIDPNDKTFVLKNLITYSMFDTYEPETYKILKEHLNEGDIVLDIGANIGLMSLIFSRIVGNKGRIYSFEPTKENFKYLCENKFLNDAKNIHPYNLAAWDKNEIVRMPKNSLQLENVQWCNGVNISDFLNKLGTNKVDFIKMDIDGAEPWAFLGLEKLIQMNPQIKMICEFYPKYIESAEGDPDAFKNNLLKCFDIEIIHGDYGDGYWNYLCLPKTQKQ
tara:strand:- start:387 stop:1208 length:822 start_codon:yes stop_codon:yes gene_type:complete